MQKSNTEIQSFGQDVFVSNRAQRLVAKIHEADRSELRVLAKDVQAMSLEVTGCGLSGALSTYAISWLNDALSQRVVEIAAKEARLPAASWCWINLGSAARQEQTLTTDQDNGLIFTASDEAEASELRLVFLPFAQEVNQQLAGAGFTLCPGNIMAGNESWCRSQDEWVQLFYNWIHRPEPEALLNATIFFDLRPLYGDLSLSKLLHEALSKWSSGNAAQIFLRLMATNALSAEPPIGFTGDIVTEKEGKDRYIDIKKFGIRIFVDAARIMALSVGVTDADTRSRFINAGPAFGLKPSDIEATLGAMSALQRIRLDYQSNVIREGGLADNHVQPSLLNSYDQVLLREGLKQAKRLQQQVRLKFQL